MISDTKAVNKPSFKLRLKTRLAHPGSFIAYVLVMISAALTIAILIGTTITCLAMNVGLKLPLAVTVSLKR